MRRYIAAIFALSLMLLLPSSLAQADPAPVTGNTSVTQNTTSPLDASNPGNASDNATQPPAKGATPDKTTAQTPPPPKDAISESGTTLLKLFVLAAILESALALLFNWRPFVATFNGRSLKTVISFFASLLVVFEFTPNALQPLVEAYNGGAKLTDGAVFLIKIIEAMVIAGGSGAVYQLFVTLGIRSPRTEQVTPKPQYDEAWISVALSGRDVAFPASVLLTSGGTELELGTLYDYARPRNFLSYFRKDRGRFPQSGGYSVKPQVPFTIRVRDAAGVPSAPSPEHNPANGAIIDIDVTLRVPPLAPVPVPAAVVVPDPPV